MPDLEVIEERGFVYGDFKIVSLPKLREMPGIHHFFYSPNLHTFIAVNLEQKDWSCSIICEDLKVVIVPKIELTN